MSSLISVATSVIEYGLLKSVLILANIRYHSFIVECKLGRQCLPNLWKKTND